MQENEIDWVVRRGARRRRVVSQRMGRGPWRRGRHVLILQAAGCMLRLGVLVALEGKAVRGDVSGWMGWDEMGFLLE